MTTRTKAKMTKNDAMTTRTDALKSRMYDITTEAIITSFYAPTTRKMLKRLQLTLWRSNAWKRKLWRLELTLRKL